VYLVRDLFPLSPFTKEKDSTPYTWEPSSLASCSSHPHKARTAHPSIIGFFFFQLSRSVLVIWFCCLHAHPTWPYCPKVASLILFFSPFTNPFAWDFKIWNSVPSLQRCPWQPQIIQRYMFIMVKSTPLLNSNDVLHNSASLSGFYSLFLCSHACAFMRFPNIYIY